MRALVLATAVFTAASATVVAPAAFAQSQSVNGTIRGRVADPTGASIPGATVTVTNPAVGATRTVTTSGDGYYTIINLPLGTYSVNFTANGFSAYNVKDVILNAGTEATIDGKMAVGGGESVVEVTASAAAIDPTVLNVQRTLEYREIDNAPLTSRNPYNFILFQPGVSGHPNQELGIPRTINTNGLMDRINYQMDGMVNTEADRTGLRLFPVANIFVKEVQTVSNSFAPEFGWTTGDVYNVISNSGSNAYHGKFQFIKRWVDATAYPLQFVKTSTSTKPNLELTDYAANAGGRIIKDKLFFFTAYEKVTRGQPSPVTISAANASAIGLTGTELEAAPGLLHGDFFLVRGDWNITPKHQFMARYNYFKNFFPLNTGVGGVNARSAGVDYRDRAHVWGLQLISTFTDHLVNEFRFSAPFRNNLYVPNPLTGNGPRVVITNIATFNGSNSLGQNYVDRQPSGSDNISYIRGAHTFKAGFVMAELQNKQRLPSYTQYTFSNYTYAGGGSTFTAVQAYQAAKNGTDPYAYSTYTSQTDTLGVSYASHFFGGYVQDTWQITPRLLTVFGVRYDRFMGPKANANAPWPDSRTFNSPAANFGPRVGVTYRASSTTVVKSSVGLFYGQPPTNNWYNALNADGSNRSQIFTYTIAHPTTNPTAQTLPGNIPSGAPSYPNPPSASGTVARQNVTTISPNMKNEYTWNATLQVQQQLTSKDSVTIGYILANGRNLPLMRNINLINPVSFLADGRPVYSTTVSATTRLNPTYDQVVRLESGVNSSFNAMFVNYTMAVRRGMQINANYTWSHSISTGPDVNSFEQNVGITDPTRLKFDRGNSVVNRPNAFNATAILEPTFNFSNHFGRELANHNMLSVLSNVKSGDQANILSATSNLTGDSYNSGQQRPSFVGRNSVRNPKTVQVDARYTRTFPKLFDRVAPAFFLEANNVFNTNNLTGATITQAVNTSTGVATSAAPTVTRTTVLEARIVQWGVKVEF